MHNCAKHQWDLFCECKQRQWNDLPRSERQAIIAEVNQPDDKGIKKTWTTWAQLVNYFKVKAQRRLKNETTQNGPSRI